MGCGSSSAYDEQGTIASNHYPKQSQAKKQQHGQQPNPASNKQIVPTASSAPTKQNSVRYNEEKQADGDSEQTEIEVRDIKTTKELLQKYVDIENEVNALEAKNTQKKSTATAAEITAMDSQIAELQKAYEEAQKMTKKEHGDYEQLWNGVLQGIYNEAEKQEDLDKEKREWMEALGAEEVALKELEAMKVKRANAEKRLSQERSGDDELQKKYKEQEELLAAIFKGKYGSDEENRLEAEHDFLMDRKQRVSAARYKWTNGRNLLQHATVQLCVGCKKWMELLKINPGDQRAKYVTATDARNNIIAATQNITSAKRYLSTIEFPYCKPNEVKILEVAAGHAYTDMLNQQRHQYVYVNVYLSMYKRCKALVDWFTYVLEETIAKDLKEATTKANSVGYELRQERLNLISIKIKEELNQDVTLEARDEPPPEDSISLAENNSEVFTADGSSKDENAGEEPPEGEIEADQPFNPVPLKDLVQAPNKEDLFGDAQELYKKHQEDMEELSRNQMINKARQEQGLEEKLKARRSRRQRQAAIAAELDVEQAEAN